MPPPQPTDPCWVYLENTVLVDLIDRREVRHADARQLLNLFQRSRNTGLLRLVTSMWAVTECHGVLYEKELIRRGIIVHTCGRRRNPRYILPPNSAALSAAHQQVVRLLHMLQTTTYDFLLWPDQSRDAVPLWQLSMQIGREAGIWPTDSMHLAIALESNCSMLITDDRDFLDKIDCCQSTLIEPYRRQQFSQLPTPPPFHAHGLLQTRRSSRIPGQSRRRPSATEALRALGFH